MSRRLLPLWLAAGASMLALAWWGWAQGGMALLQLGVGVC